MNGDIDPNDDDTKSLLNKDTPNSTQKSSKYKSKIKKKKKQTFCQWLFSKPLSKLPFVYFFVGLLSVPVLAIFHFMDADTSFIICGGYIALNIFGLKHFYTLLGLKKQVDDFGGLNKKFGTEQRKLSVEVNRIGKMNASLSNTHSRLQAANVKNRENLNQFAQLQETIKALNLKSVEELKDIVTKCNGIGDSWQKELVEHERDMLHTVFDRYELTSGKSGMTRKEFEEFTLQLPDSYRIRFARLGTFDKLSADGKHLKFSDFDAALDLFAEMDALDCDIDFSIQKTKDSSRGSKLLIDLNDELPSSTLEVVPSQEDWGDDISDMKRWKTQRKMYDNVKRKIVVHSKDYRSAAAKTFTSSLGFDVMFDNKTDDDDSDLEEQEAYLSNQSASSIRAEGGLGRMDRHDTKDLIMAGKQESFRSNKSNKSSDEDK